MSVLETSHGYKVQEPATFFKQQMVQNLFCQKQLSHMIFIARCKNKHVSPNIKLDNNNENKK